MRGVDGVVRCGHLGVRWLRCLVAVHSVRGDMCTIRGMEVYNSELRVCCDGCVHVCDSVARRMMCNSVC